MNANLELPTWIAVGFIITGVLNLIGPFLVTVMIKPIVVINRLISKILKSVTPKRGFILTLLYLQRTPRRQFLAYIGFTGLLYFCFQSWTKSGVMLLSMLIHEYGHLSIFKRNGIEASIKMIFPLGAVAIPINKAMDVKSDRLPIVQAALLFQMGLINNLALISIGMLIMTVTHGWWQQLGRDIMQTNQALALLNLLPIGMLDGGQLFNAFYVSLTKRQATYFSLAYTWIIYTVLVVLFQPPVMNWSEVTLKILFNLMPIIFLAISLLSIWWKRAHIVTVAEEIPRMTSTQLLLQSCIYLLMVLVILFGSPLQ